MYKSLLAFLVVAIIVVLAIAGRFFFSNTPFPEKARYLYINTGHTTREEVMAAINKQELVRNPKSFEFLATQMDVWPKVKAGKYEIRKGMGLFDIARVLRNGKQTPVNLVITKLRTKENLASLIGRRFEIDSMQAMNFFNNPDTLRRFQLDTLSVMTTIFPNTYTYLWTASPSDIYKKLYAEYKKVWNEDRKHKADSLGLSPTKAYILASIVEEETTNDKEKGLMASVYLNRLARNMNLGADPTVKFALRNFGLKRVYEKHLATESPYNTYRYKGLPPGPICTPSLKTLDYVLNAPRTDYLFFVAKKDFSQEHIFTSKYQEHIRYAKEYRQALNQQEQQKRKSSNEDVEE